MSELTLSCNCKYRCLLLVRPLLLSIRVRVQLGRIHLENSTEWKWTEARMKVEKQKWSINIAIGIGYSNSTNGNEINCLVPSGPSEVLTVPLCFPIAHTGFLTLPRYWPYPSILFSSFPSGSEPSRGTNRTCRSHQVTNFFVWCTEVNRAGPYGSSPIRGTDRTPLFRESLCFSNLVWKPPRLFHTWPCRGLVTFPFLLTVIKSDYETAKLFKDNIYQDHALILHTHLRVTRQLYGLYAKVSRVCTIAF